MDEPATPTGRLPKDKKPNHEFDDGDVWGNVIFSDPKLGTSAWIYWNAILDETGAQGDLPIHGTPIPMCNIRWLSSTRPRTRLRTGTYYYLALQ
jgi:hypothetical protein